MTPVRHAGNDWIVIVESLSAKSVLQFVAAVRADRFIVSWHADERCEERGVTAWQLVAGIEEAELLCERLRSKPSPSVVLRQ